MQTTQDIISKLQKKKEEWMRQYGVLQLALFGSYARNEQKETSDVDVIVEFEKPISGLRFVSLAEAIEAAIGLPADVVPFDGIKPRHLDFVGKDLVYV